MRNRILSFAMILVSTSALAAGEVQLKPGKYGLMPFLEMVSEKLDLQIDASGLDDPKEVLNVPDTGPVPAERAKELAVTVLYFGGYAWIHDGVTDIYRVQRLRDARDQELPIVPDASKLPDSDQMVTTVLPVEHIGPESVARAMRSFMPAFSRIIPDESTNSVLITDSARNIAKLRTLTKQLDTPEAGKHRKETPRNSDPSCPPLAAEGPSLPVLIALFSLIALIIGFLARGYVIRRIEGGL